MNKRILGIIAVILLCTININKVFAAEMIEPGKEIVYNTWQHPGNGWHYLTGTDISVKIENNCVYIYGTGDIPDFDIWKLHERPWGGTNVEYVSIAPTITSVGKYAFYGISTLKRVDIHTTTFIDNTSFDKIAQYPVFRVYGDIGRDWTDGKIGDIGYTSLDSIKAYAQFNMQGASFIVDSKKDVDAFRNSTNPTLKNVYYASEIVTYKENGKEIKEAPWTNVNKHTNGGKYTQVIKLSKDTPDNTISVVAQRKYQGEECMKAFSAFKGDYEYATSFTITVTKENKPVQEYHKLKYELSIPSEYNKGNREFKLLAIGAGTVYEYTDLDKNSGTITFETDKPSTAYALVYKDR